MLKDIPPEMKNVCFISGLEHRSVYLRMSGSGNEGLLKRVQLCDAPGARKKFMRDLNIHPQCIVLRSARARVHV